MNPVMDQLPESKRTADVEAALAAYNVTDMGTLADALVSANSLKGEVETIKGQLGEAKTKYDTLVGEVPGSSDGYGIANLDKSDEGKKILGVFVEAKIPKSAAAKIASVYQDVSTETVARDTAARETRLSEFKASLGDKDFDLAQRGAEMLYPGEDKLSIRERYLSDPDAIPGLAIAGRVGVENPKVFQPQSGGSGSSVLYKSMESRGIK